MVLRGGGKKKKSKGPAMVKFEHIVKDMVVVLKRDVHCTVRSPRPSRREGVTILPRALDGVLYGQRRSSAGESPGFTLTHARTHSLTLSLVCSGPNR
jgi:hypothetical protein